MTDPILYDHNGQPVTAESVSAVKEAPDTGKAIKALTEHLSRIATEMAGTRLALFPLTGWTARGWAKPIKDGEVLGLYARITAEWRDDKGREREATEQGHGKMGLADIATSDGADILAMISGGIVARTVAAILNRLIEAGLRPKELPMLGVKCAGCGAASANGPLLEWTCTCGHHNPGTAK